MKNINLIFLLFFFGSCAKWDLKRDNPLDGIPNKNNPGSSSLSPPALSSPATDILLHGSYLQFSWLISGGADSYDFELARDTGFAGNPVYTYDTKYSSITIGDGSFNPYWTGSENGDWYWRVRAKTYTKFSPWSVRFHFVYQY